MRKVIAAMNMTIDGFCDHTVGIPDAALHQHYADLLKDGGVALYGRITYQLMEYWRTVLEKPTGEKATDDFAVAIDAIPKIVFSHTLKEVDWASATLSDKGLEEKVAELKQSPGKDIFVCSPGLIAQLAKQNLIDEYQLCIHPIIAGSGLILFKNISEHIMLDLVKTKPFDSGVIILYYEQRKREMIHASIYIANDKIGDVYFSIIDQSMGAIGGNLVANENYKKYQKSIQQCCEIKGIANIEDFNFRILLRNIIELNPEGGIGITDCAGFDSIYVESAGLDLSVFK